MAVLLLASRCVLCGAPTSVAMPCDCVALKQWEAAKHQRDARGRFGSGQTTVPLNMSMRGYGVDESDEAKLTIKSALDALPPDISGGFPRVVVATAENEKDLQRAQPVVQARVYPGDPNIYVSHWGSAYRNAQKGKPAELAGALAHEVWHLRNGMEDEEGAYDQQLKVLRQLRAPSTLIRDVEHAKELVLYTQRFERRKKR